MITFNSLEEMLAFGERLGQLMFEGFVLTLNGDLAAGKTTFTKGIGKGLGVKKIINSPTFTILKSYNGRLPLYHFDVYRLEDGYEELGFEELFDGDGVCVIEWPEFIEEHLPDERLEIYIHINSDDTRTFEFKAKGQVYEGLLKELL